MNPPQRIQELDDTVQRLVGTVEAVSASPITRANLLIRAAAIVLRGEDAR